MVKDSDVPHNVCYHVVKMFFIQQSTTGCVACSSIANIFTCLFACLFAYFATFCLLWTFKKNVCCLFVSSVFPHSWSDALNASKLMLAWGNHKDSPTSHTKALQTTPWKHVCKFDSFDHDQMVYDMHITWNYRIVNLSNSYINASFN